MILIGADFDKPDFVAFLDFEADVLQCSLDRFGKGLFPIFHGTDQVIEEKRLVMTLGDVFAHPKRLHLREPTPHATCEVLRNKLWYSISVASDENTHVLYGEAAVRQLDLRTLEKLAHDSEIEYAKSPDEMPVLIQKWHQRMRGVMETNQVAAVTVGDKPEVVSVAGFFLLGRTDDGRPVYEAGRSVTLLDHRHHGYYKIAMGKVMEEIRRLAPNAVIVRSTQKSEVRANAGHSGFVPIDQGTYDHYRANGSGKKMQTGKSPKGDEYEYFALDLLKKDAEIDR